MCWPRLPKPRQTAGPIKEITDVGSAMVSGTPGAPAAPPPASPSLSDSWAHTASQTQQDLADFTGRHTWFKPWLHWVPSQGCCETYTKTTSEEKPPHSCAHSRHWPKVILDYPNGYSVLPAPSLKYCKSASFPSLSSGYQKAPPTHPN